jgi:hypothetical protein
LLIIVKNGINTTRLINNVAEREPILIIMDVEQPKAKMIYKKNKTGEFVV